MKILIVNPNTNAVTTDLLVDVARGSVDERATFIGVTAESGPTMITGPAALLDSATEVVSAAVAAIARHSPDAVIIGAFGDPGATELRALTDIPIIGIGQAAILSAASGGRRFAIATTTGELAPALTDLVKTVCPAGDFAGVYLTRTDALTLATDPEASVVELGAVVDDAVAAGARAVIIGGGPLSDTARLLAARTDVTIIEPVPSAVAMVLAALRSPV